MRYFKLILCIGAFLYSTLSYGINFAGQTPKILPLGDSITAGGYRYKLKDLSTASTQVSIDYIGSRSDPESDAYPDTQHDGWPGRDVYSILNEVSLSDPSSTQTILDYSLSLETPDIVLIHLGTNDLLYTLPEDRDAQINKSIYGDDGNGGLKEIIRRLRVNNPDIVILLAQITPLDAINNFQPENIPPYNAAVAQLGEALNTPASPVIIVDQFSGIDPQTDLQDGVHPNNAGEQKMANTWFAALEPFFLPPHSLPSNEWHQISLPLDPGVSNTVAEIFGDDELGEYGTEWIIYRYDTVQDNYVALTLSDTLSQGTGYWIIQLTGSPKTLDMPVNSTITPVTSPDSCSGERCFQVSLGTEANDNQWNMIGYPFNTTGRFTEARIITTDTICSSGCTITEAEIAGLFHSQVWTYDGTGYVTVDSTNENLDPWLGYWAATLGNADTSNPSLLFTHP